jgi:hypothetical protein
MAEELLDENTELWYLGGLAEFVESFRWNSVVSVAGFWKTLDFRLNNSYIAQQMNKKLQL